MSIIQGILSFISLTIFSALCGLHYFGHLSAKYDCETSYTFEKDWGNLQRHSSSNTQLLGSTNEVVFMGDSITDRMNISMLFPNKPYVNRGIGGQITSQMLLRFRSDVINLHPRVVVILGGTNDLKKMKKYHPIEGILENVKSMAELARVNNIQVIIASLLPVCGEKADGRPPFDILRVNKLLFEYASQNGIIYLDYFYALVGSDGLLKQELTTDCLHINEAGYMIMAPFAEAAIQKAQKTNSN